jgi:hypothetical protein
MLNIALKNSRLAYQTRTPSRPIGLLGAVRGCYPCVTLRVAAHFLQFSTTGVSVNAPLPSKYWQDAETLQIFAVLFIFMRQLSSFEKLKTHAFYRMGSGWSPITMMKVSQKRSYRTRIIGRQYGRY